MQVMFAMIFVLFMSLFASSSLLFGMKSLCPQNKNDEYGLSGLNYVTQEGKDFMVKAPEILDRDAFCQKSHVMPADFWLVKQEFDQKMANAIIGNNKQIYSVCEKKAPYAVVANVTLDPITMTAQTFYFNLNASESEFANQNEVYHLILYDFLMKTASIEFRKIVVDWDHKRWYWDNKQCVVMSYKI